VKDLDDLTRVERHVVESVDELPTEGLKDEKRWTACVKNS
jgi:hypothetical protein